MAVWINTPASISLADEFNRAFPARGRASDGTIGDPAHARTSSNHNPDETGRTPREDSDLVNEVHARDIDKDLNRKGWSMSRAVGVILGRCRAGVEKRLFEIIWNGHIYTELYDWRERDYSGPNAHTEHAHFSFKYGSGGGTGNPENITAPWGILATIRSEEVADMADANVTGFDTDARAILQQEATDGSIGYKGGGLPTWDGAPPMGTRNYLNAFTKLFNMVAELASRPPVSVDVTALAVAIAANLPTGTLTIVDVEEAVKNALRSGTDS